ncbi:hypothetical protein ACIQV3_09370 [Streptomyces sp. NPDC099050]|uniref:hypothetical protein n=1 Tax=Streptomyces sp. NPDC099050 TaxID=3366100 RepID=UPI0037FD05B8
MTAICGRTTPKTPEPCPTAPAFLVADEHGNVTSCCGHHIGTAMPDTDVTYTVVRTTDDTAARLLGRLVTRAGTPA